MKLRGVSRRFGATIALDNVDFDVEPGEVHALIGENGAGKSTLLNVIAETIPGVAHIHQELSLCPHLTVAENILLGREPARRGFLLRDELNARARTLLAEFDRTDIDPNTRVMHLSLADQQIIEICRALAADASLILMDEPTSSLQRASVEHLFAIIRRLAARGIAIVYVSHFLEEVREIAVRYTVLRDGRNVISGSLSEITDDELIRAMVGHRHPERSEGPLLRTTSATERPFAALRVTNLSAPPRLHHASFELHRGEILGIAGLIGSGRTEMIRAIFGLTPSTGSITVDRSRLGYLSEDRKGEGLALQLSVADNVTITRFPSRLGWLDLEAQAAQTHEQIERLRIKALPQTRTFALSGGNQQKVALARLLHQRCDVLLLDEPARGIDIGAKSDIYREIANLAASGKAILVVSSYLPELFAICDRIAVMSRGRLGDARPASEWTPDSILEAAIGSDAA